MGGRGARPSVPGWNPGMRHGGSHWSGGLGTKVDSTLREAIGSKGTPIPIASAYEEANPHFDKTGSYREYNENCQRSVIAYELRRRGYDVVAQPTYEGDILPRETVGGNAHWMGAFKDAKSINVGADRNSTVRKNIESKMGGFGHGSRGIVRVRWQGSNSGHVFNVENVHGRVIYMDAQTGRRVNIKTYLGASSPASTRLVRTDNLRLSDRARQSVTTRRY